MLYTVKLQLIHNISGEYLGRRKELIIWATEKELARMGKGPGQ